MPGHETPAERASDPARTRRVNLRRAASVAVPVVVPVVVVLTAGVAGWVRVGPPDPTPLTPPACPAIVAGGPAEPAWRAATADRIVPVPLPQPRGPVAVRICGEGRDVVVDPPRTARLVGVLDSPDRPADVVAGAVAAGGRRVAAPYPAGCTPGEPVDLVFRYVEGPPFRVRVDTGGCAIVATPERVERGRTDVLAELRDALG